jgi:hypothetical protein
MEKRRRKASTKRAGLKARSEAIWSKLPAAHPGQRINTL